MTREIQESLSRIVDAVGTSGVAARIANAVKLPSNRWLPTGGSTDQALVKNSNADYDVHWATVTVGGTPTLPRTQLTKTNADISVASNAWTDLDTSSDLVVAAATGDVLIVSVSGSWAAATTVNGYLEAITVVASSPVNYITTGTTTAGTLGIPCAYARLSASGGSLTEVPFGGTTQYVVQAGDIDTGNVRLRLRGKLSAATPARLIYARTSLAFHWHAVNLGH